MSEIRVILFNFKLHFNNAHESVKLTTVILMAKKKDDYTQFCVDYRCGDAATIKVSYLLQRLDWSLNRLYGI